MSALVGSYFRVDTRLVSETGMRPWQRLKIGSAETETVQLGFHVPIPYPSTSASEDSPKRDPGLRSRPHQTHPLLNQSGGFCRNGSGTPWTRRLRTAGQRRNAAGRFAFRRKRRRDFSRQARPAQIPPLIELPRRLSTTERVLDDTDTEEDLRLLLAPGASLGGTVPRRR